MMWLFLATFIFVPVCVVIAEAITNVRTRSFEYIFSDEEAKTFQVLVPIWGNIKYLENVDYLKQYNSQVTLCTTGDESEEFYLELGKLSQQYGFKIFKDVSVRSTKNISESTERSTSGTIRDRIIRNALRTVTSEYVVPLDADSTTEQSLEQLIGEIDSKGYDIASIKIVPRNQSSLLATLQTFEYDVAMRFRLITPWLLSGACHPAKTKVLSDIMDRHSLFFQGNDVETGLIAKSLGYKVGHIPFVVLTTVPDGFKAWFRQRLAWAGGEFRLFVVNFSFIIKHPVFWFYGLFISILLLPLRAYTLIYSSRQLIYILTIYLFLCLFVHWKRTKSLYLFLMPVFMLYTVFLSLIMLPLGILWYFHMAKKDDNYGIIRPDNIKI